MSGSNPSVVDTNLYFAQFDQIRMIRVVFKLHNILVSPTFVNGLGYH